MRLLGCAYVQSRDEITMLYPSHDEHRADTHRMSMPGWSEVFARHRAIPSPCMSVLPAGST